MSPDDPRHGSTRGFHAGCREACCRQAQNRYEKASKYRKHAGIVWAIPALGTQRRIQALMRLGWSSTQIAEEAGFLHRNQVFGILKGQRGRPCRYVERKTARAVGAAFERLSMRLPAPTPSRARTIAMAETNGWPPPLAWDDIDDPNEEPSGWAYQPTAESIRCDALLDLADMGIGLTEACRRLGTTADALHKWCSRNGLSPAYRTLAAREQLRANQFSDPRAAVPSLDAERVAS